MVNLKQLGALFQKNTRRCIEQKFHSLSTTRSSILCNEKHEKERLLSSCRTIFMGTPRKDSNEQEIVQKIDSSTSKSTLDKFMSSSNNQNKLGAIIHKSTGLVVSDEVLTAQAEGKPVVALESAIITHGMPSPDNLLVAMKLEATIREKGCVPATVGVVNGTLVVGLSLGQLCRLADTKADAMKISTRDVPYALAMGRSGGTTVSATLLACRLAGIRVFVTGGIGGVHRTHGDASATWDVSADLVELGRCGNVGVVCAGVKSILDVPATLEYLETQGVSVTVLDPSLPPSTDLSSVRFPDFFTRGYDVAAPSFITAPLAAARMLQAANTLALKSGMLFAVPIPREAEPMGEEIKKAIEESLQEAHASGIAGRDVTPFVLSSVAQKTARRSLEANTALILNNAAVGAEVAKELFALEARPLAQQNSVSLLQFDTSSSEAEPEFSAEQDQDPPHPVVVVGGSIVDFVATVKEPKIELVGRTHLGSVRQSYGGVGRNMADALAHLGAHPLLISAVGDDSHAGPLLAHNPQLDPRGCLRSLGATTATYCALLDHKGEALLGVGDMAAHSAITPDWVSQFSSNLVSARLVVCDGNLSQETLDYVLTLCADNTVPVWFEPTDVQKASKPWVGAAAGRGVTFASPNLNELRALAAELNLGDVPPSPSSPCEVEPLLKQVLRVAGPLLAPPTTSTSIGHQSATSATTNEATQMTSAGGAGKTDPIKVDLQGSNGKDSLRVVGQDLSLRALMVTLGPHGFMIVRRCEEGAEDCPLLPRPASDSDQEESFICQEGTYHSLERVVGLYFQPPEYDEIVSVSGAGDCLASGFVTGMLSGRPVSECAAVGNSAARLSLQALPTVPGTLSGLRTSGGGLPSLPYILIC